MIVKRGEIWRVAVGQRNGPRKLGPRETLPCLVVSPPELHDFLATVLLAPVSHTAAPAPFRVATLLEGRKAFILLDQLQTVDKSRLVRRVGKLGPAALRDSLATLQQTFAP